MPTYELALMLRTMTRPELASSIKRFSDVIFSKGGFLRKIDNLGDRTLPFKMYKNSVKHKTGHAIIITFDAPPKCLYDLKDEYMRDVDILRNSIFKMNKAEDFDFNCTLDVELQPPSYRPEVIEMMKIAAKNQKEKYPQYTGLKYYPFQK